MIITLLVLAVDWAVMAANGHSAMQYHAVVIAILVVSLWRYKQPERYVINEAVVESMKR